MHRAPCRQARDPLRGPGADPPGHPRTLRGHRRRRGPWAAAASRPRVELLGRRFSTGGRVLRHRKLPELRAGARRQRRRGALHPHAEGESVVGAELRDDRGAPPGLARVQADVQRAVDAGEVRLPKPGPGATRPPRAGLHGPPLPLRLPAQRGAQLCGALRIRARPCRPSSPYRTSSW